MDFPTFTKLEDVPEAFRTVYKEVDGKWIVPKPDEPADDPVELKESLRSERTKRDAAEKLLTKATNEMKKLENKQKAESAGLNDEQLKQLREDVRVELEAEYAPFKENAEKFGKENRELKLDNQVKSLAAENGVRPERLAAWWKLNSDKFDLTDDGKPVIKDHPGKEVKKFIAEDLKSEIPDFYTGTKAAGGGGTGGLGSKPQSDSKSAELVLSDPEELLRRANREAAAA